MPKKPQYPWKKWEARFVHEGEWVDFPRMHKTILEECKAAGMKAPAFGYLQKQAALYKWTDKRNKVEAARDALALKQAGIDRGKEITAARRTFEQHRNLGQGLVAMGANYLKALQEAQEKARLAGRDAPGVITTPYEALAFIRVGSQLATMASKGILDLFPDPPKPAPSAGVTTEELEGDQDRRTPEEIRADIQSRLLRIAASSKTS